MSGIVTNPHDHQWLTPMPIAIGSGVWNCDVPALIADRITHVIDCRNSTDATPFYTGTSIDLHRAPTEDNGGVKIRWFRRPVEWAIAALTTPNARLLVHCEMGINRGPSMAYAILRALGWDSMRAERTIRKARPRVFDPKYGSPNGYMRDADEFVRQWERSRAVTKASGN